MLTSFTVDAVFNLYRQYVQISGALWHDWFYRSKSEEFVNNKTYKWIYDFFKNGGVNMSAYVPPATENIPNVPRSSIEGKKTSFTTAEITRIVYAIPRFSKWTPAEILPYTSGINFMDYRGTYIALYNLGGDLSGYVHPDVVLALSGGAKVVDDKVLNQSKDVSFDFGKIVLYFFIGLWLLLCVWILRYFFKR